MLCRLVGWHTEVKALVVQSYKVFPITAQEVVRFSHKKYVFLMKLEQKSIFYSIFLTCSGIFLGAVFLKYVGNIGRTYTSILFIAATCCKFFPLICSSTWGVFSFTQFVSVENVFQVFGYYRPFYPEELRHRLLGAPQGVVLYDDLHLATVVGHVVEDELYLVCHSLYS